MYTAIHDVVVGSRHHLCCVWVEKCCNSLLYDAHRDDPPTRDMELPSRALLCTNLSTIFSPDRFWVIVGHGQNLPNPLGLLPSSSSPPSVTRPVRCLVIILSIARHTVGTGRMMLSLPRRIV